MVPQDALDDRDRVVSRISRLTVGPSAGVPSAPALAARGRVSRLNIDDRPLIVVRLGRGLSA